MKSSRKILLFGIIVAVAMPIIADEADVQGNDTLITPDVAVIEPELKVMVPELNQNNITEFYELLVQMRAEIDTLNKAYENGGRADAELKNRIIHVATYYKALKNVYDERLVQLKAEIANQEQMV